MGRFGTGDFTHEPAQGGSPRAARRDVSARSASGATSSRFMVPIRVQFLENAASHEPHVRTGGRPTYIQESQRDSVPKPRVGPRSGPTLGRVVPAKSSTPTGLRLRRVGATPLGLVETCVLSRGSSFLATPGFGSQSLRDWKPLMLPPRFMVRKQVDFEQAALHEPRLPS